MKIIWKSKMSSQSLVMMRNHLQLRNPPHHKGLTNWGSSAQSSRQGSVLAWIDMLLCTTSHGLLTLRMHAGNARSLWLWAISTECNLLGEPVNTPSQPALSFTPEVEAEVPKSAEPEGEEPLPTPVVADAHCHVDLLLSWLHTKSYDDAKDDFFHPEESVELV